MVLGFTQELFSPAADGGTMDAEAADADFEAMAAVLPHLTAMVASEVHDNAEDPLGWCDSQGVSSSRSPCSRWVGQSCRSLSGRVLRTGATR